MSTEKKKFCCVIVRTGCVFVEADTPEEAADIANHQTTDTINWSDDWDVTETFPDDSACPGSYITEKAFM